MTVQELIEELQKVEDKTLQVWLRAPDPEFGDEFDEPCVSVTTGEVWHGLANNIPNEVLIINAHLDGGNVFEFLRKQGLYH